MNTTTSMLYKPVRYLQLHFLSGLFGPAGLTRTFSSCPGAKASVIIRAFCNCVALLWFLGSRSKCLPYGFFDVLKSHLARVSLLLRFLHFHSDHDWVMSDRASQLRHLLATNGRCVGYLPLLPGWHYPALSNI